MPQAEKPTPTVDDALEALEALEYRIGRFDSLLDGLEELARITMEGAEKLGVKAPMRLHTAHFVYGVNEYWKELREALRDASEVGYYRQKGGE